MSWKPEVIADNTGKWCGNLLRFATREEAESWVKDRMMRWTAVRDTRVIETDDPVTHKWEQDGGWLTEYEPPDPPGWEGGFADNH